MHSPRRLRPREVQREGEPYRRSPAGPFRTASARPGLVRAPPRFAQRRLSGALRHHGVVLPQFSGRSGRPCPPRQLPGRTIGPDGPPARAGPRAPDHPRRYGHPCPKPGGAMPPVAGLGRAKALAAAAPLSDNTQQNEDQHNTTPPRHPSRSGPGGQPGEAPRGPYMAARGSAATGPIAPVPTPGLPQPALRSSCPHSRRADCPPGVSGASARRGLFRIPLVITKSSGRCRPGCTEDRKAHRKGPFFFFKRGPAGGLGSARSPAAQGYQNTKEPLGTQQRASCEVVFPRKAPRRSARPRFTVFQ